MVDQELLREVERRVAQATGVFVVAHPAGPGVVRLQGVLDDPRLRAAVRAAAGATPGVQKVIDELELVSAEPLADGDLAPLAAALRWEVPEEGAPVEVPLVEEGEEDEATVDALEAAEEGLPFFPPTDPVLRPSREGELEPAAGFAATSMDELTGEAPLEGEEPPGDEAIAEDVRRELAEDALTCELDVQVEVQSGVVVLRGRVKSLDEAEAAEEVARRVPGVLDVEDALEVAGPA